jgi:hypothetical protein
MLFLIFLNISIGIKVFSCYNIRVNRKEVRIMTQAILGKDYSRDIAKLNNTAKNIRYDIESVTTELAQASEYDLELFLSENKSMLESIMYKLNLIKDNQPSLNKEDIYKLNRLLPSISDIIKNIAL